jgi:hypothetical protein
MQKMGTSESGVHKSKIQIPDAVIVNTLDSDAMASCTITLELRETQFQ